MRKALLHLKKSDPVMAAIIERAGPYRIGYSEPEFATLLSSIVFQQLNGRAADTILNRVIAAAGGKLTPQRILKLSDETLRAAGLSRQKIAYMRDLAEHTRDRRLRFANLSQLSDPEIVEALTQVKGIGEWTAQMFLMFALRRHNILPVADYGVRSAIRKAYGMKELPTPLEMRTLAEAWEPYCSVASWYLWRSLEFKDAEVQAAKAEKAADGKTKSLKPSNRKKPDGKRGR